MMLTTLLLVPLLQEPAALDLGRWLIDPARSEVGFHGTSTLHDFTGRTRAVRGELRTVLWDPSVLTAGHIQVDAATLDTENGERDEKMRKHLDVERFPTIDFVLAKAKGALEGGSGAVEVVGSFKIHGVDRERRAVIDVARLEDGALHLTGGLRFDMSEHGIAPPSVAGVINVGDAVEVFLDLVLTPAPGAPLEATAYAVEMHERTEPTDGEPTERAGAERLWVHGDGALWTRDADGKWLEARGGAVRAHDLVRGETLPPVPPAEASFEEARERAANLRAKLEALPGPRRQTVGRRIQEAVERLEAGLALAPAEGAATVETSGGATVVRLGEHEWVRAEGRVGEHRAVALLAGLEGLPSAVRDVLGQIDGVPERLVVRTVVPQGARLLELRFGPPAAGRLPAWAAAPGDWLAPAGAAAEEVSR